MSVFEDDLTPRLGQVEAYDEKHLLPVGPGGFAVTFVCGDPRPAGAVVTPVTLRSSDGEIDWFGDNWCASCSEWVDNWPTGVLYMVAPEDGDGLLGGAAMSAVECDIEYRVVEWYDGEREASTRAFTSLAEAVSCATNFEKMGCGTSGVVYSVTIEARQVGEWRPLS